MNVSKTAKSNKKAIKAEAKTETNKKVSKKPEIIIQKIIIEDDEYVPDIQPNNEQHIMIPPKRSNKTKK